MSRFEDICRESRLIAEIERCAAERDGYRERAEATAEVNAYLWRELRAARAEVARLAAVLAADTPITEEDS